MTIKKPTKGESNFLKLVGVVTMFIEHAGILFFSFIPQAIGRIAYPLFAYQLAVGYKATSNRDKYARNLLILAVVSEIPYYLYFGRNFNIGFILFFGLALIWAIENKKYLHIPLILIPSLFVSYRLYGLALILIFYFVKNKVELALLFTGVVTAYGIGYIGLYHGAFEYGRLQLFALLALPLIFKPLFELKLPKKFFYIFYPAHILILFLFESFFF